MHGIAVGLLHHRRQNAPRRLLWRGAEGSPVGVQNLRANPEAHVEVGTESYDVIARELPPDERDALFDKLVDLAPMFGDYQAKTSRVIPLFELQKAERTCADGDKRRHYRRAPGLLAAGVVHGAYRGVGEFRDHVVRAGQQCTQQPNTLVVLGGIVGVGERVVKSMADLVVDLRQIL